MLLQSLKNGCPLIGWKISPVSKPSERDLSILSSNTPNLSIYMLTWAAKECHKQRMKAAILETFAGILQSRCEIRTNPGKRFDYVLSLYCNSHKVSLQDQILRMP